MNVSQLITEYVSPFFSRFIVALLIFFMGVVIGRIADKLVQRALHEIELNLLVKKFTGMNMAVEEIIAHGLSFFIYLITVVLALRHMGLAAGVFYILMAGVIMVIVLSLFLTLKDFLPNALSGMQLLLSHKLQKGDHLSLLDMSGKVTEFNLLETHIKTKGGDTIAIPNSLLSKNVLVIKKRSYGEGLRKEV